MNYDANLHPVQPLVCTINGLHASLAVQVGTPTHREDGMASIDAGVYECRHCAALVTTEGRSAHTIWHKDTDTLLILSEGG